MGRHLLFTESNWTSSEAILPTLPKIAFVDRLNERLALLTEHLNCRSLIMLHFANPREVMTLHGWYAGTFYITLKPIYHPRRGTYMYGWGSELRRQQNHRCQLVKCSTLAMSLLCSVFDVWSWDGRQTDGRRTDVSKCRISRRSSNNHVNTWRAAFEKLYTQYVKTETERCTQ